MNSRKSDQKYLVKLVILVIMGVTIAGCTPKRQTVDFGSFISFTTETQDTWFAWQDPDKWELKILDGGIERAHWVGIGEKLYVRDYNGSQYWEIKNPGISFSSVIDVRKLNDEQWQLDGDRYRIMNKNYKSGREQIQHFVWLDPVTKLPIKQQLTGDTGTVIVKYSGINTTTINVPSDTKITGTDPFLLPNSMMATYSAEMKLRGLPMVWPFFKL